MATDVAAPEVATGLEWEATDTPPAPHNFDSVPVVTREAYDYAELDARAASGAPEAAHV